MTIGKKAWLLTALLVAFFCSHANAQFTEIQTGITGLSSSSVAWGDYDSDGDLDIVAIGYGPGGGNSSTITKIYQNDGNNIFTSINHDLTNLTRGSVAWGDYDNDGDLDLSITGVTPDGNNTSRVYRNDANGVFTDINVSYQGAFDGSATWADHDNDGDLDALITGAGLTEIVTRLYSNNGSDSFTEVPTGFQPVYKSDAAWGDYDNDGDLDLIIAGDMYPHIYTTVPVTNLYRNDGNGQFTGIATGLPGVVNCALAWGDYDNDGDLDIVLSGYSVASGTISEIYRNDGNNIFTSINAGLQALQLGSTSWGDFNNDGLLDILHVGYESSSNPSVSKVYLNGGNDLFIDINANLAGVRDSDAAWGDYDNDGDLDILLTGSGITKIYRNDYNTPNTAPLSPNNLRTTVLDSEVLFQWDAPSDVQTPSQGLSYVMRIGTNPDGCDITSPMSDQTGYRHIPVVGYATAKCEWGIQKSVLQSSEQYYWSVQAIDTSLEGSMFASESVLNRIELISPNGGEQWQANTSKTVYWVTTANEVNIQLSIDDGSNWITLNSEPIPAVMGRYTFQVPSVTSNQCMIKIVSTLNSNVFDLSDYVFSISNNTPVSIVLTSPTSSKLRVGNSYPINWLATGINDVRLEYSINGGIDWSNIVQSIPANTGSYVWTVPDTPAIVCYIRCSDATNNSMYDINETPFTISTLNLFSPNGGELMQAGKPFSITWNSDYIATIKLEYSDNNGANWTPIVPSAPATAGNYCWLVPSSIATGSTYIIRISDVDYPEVNDTSANTFTMTSLVVTYPSNVGEKVQTGRNVNITWEQQFLSGTVKIELTMDGGQSFSTLAAGIDVAQENYTWIVPDTPSTSCRIRITYETATIISDESDGNFVISSLTLTSPNGSEIWGAGSTHTVTWSSINVSDLRLEYSDNNGASWNQITNSTSASSGSYNWTLPIVNSTQCILRLTDVNSDAVYDISDGIFSILPPISIITPNGGEIFFVNSPHSITWSSFPDVQFVLIDFSIDDGSNWISVLDTPYPSAIGNYNWSVPNTPSIDCLIRVRSSVHNDVFCISDSVFSILSHPPVVDLPDSLTFNEDEQLVFDMSPYVEDIDNDPITINVSGTVNVQAAIDDMDVTFYSSENWNGVENISISFSDNTPGSSPIIAVVTIIVLPIYDPPVIELPDSFSFNEDGNLVIDMNQHAFHPDNIPMVLTSSGSQNIIVCISGMTVTLGAPADWNGSEQVTFTVDDNTVRSGRNGRRTTASDTVNIVVTPVNDSPMLTLPDSFTFEEDGSLLIDIALYSSDIDGNPLTLSVTGNQNITVQISGMNVTLGALPNWNGSEQITLTVNDNMGRAIASDVASIIVTPVNDAPTINLPASFTFVEDGFLELDLSQYVDDVDNDNLTLSASGNQNIAISITGMLATLSAPANWNGAEQVTFTVDDNVTRFATNDRRALATDTVEIIVTPGNDTPTLVLPASFTFEEDGSLLIDIGLYSSDIDADPLTLSVNGNQNITAQISGMNVSLGALQDWNGTEQVTFTVNDNMGRAVASDAADIIVSPVNDAPTIVSFLPDQTQINAQMNEIITFSVTVSDIDSNITISWFVNDIDQGNSTNEFSYQFTQSGTYTVKASIADEDFSIEQIWTVILPVANVDDTLPPTITRLYQNYPNPFNPTTSIRFSVKESGPVNIAVFDIKGRLVRQIVNQYMAAGTYNNVWDGMDNNNNPSSTGIYLIKMKTPDSLNIVKACMVK